MRHQKWVENRGRGSIAVVVLGSVLALAVLAGGNRAAPYDLDSAAPTGYKAYRLTLEELDLGVDRIELDEVTPSALERFSVVVVVDGGGAGDEEVAQLRRFAEAGGRVVASGPIPGLGGWARTADGWSSSVERSGGEHDERGEVCDIAGESEGGESDTCRGDARSDVAGWAVGLYN